MWDNGRVGICSLHLEGVERRHRLDPADHAAHAHTHVAAARGSVVQRGSGEIERQRERQTERSSKSERQRKTERERQRESKTERETERERDRDRDRDGERQRERHTQRQRANRPARELGLQLDGGDAVAGRESVRRCARRLGSATAAHSSLAKANSLPTAHSLRLILCPQLTREG